ncbi:TonB-dependent receptor [Algoriphagus litoralis]|uniref:TonB-dependent receptor n=1 Tax=Algoriphagus litoralis TaxID=2202829 RepID=UPI0018E547B0|nr:TonB-dependent receptor [Algoriphagus litoralis]
MNESNHYLPNKMKAGSSCRIFVMTLMLSMMSVLSLAQTQGNIKGKVIEQATKQPMIGVTVQVENSEKGAITDEGGNFSIENVPIGSYALSISFVGFQTKKVTDVIISSGKTYYAEFELLDEVGDLGEVTVMAFKGESNPTMPVSAFSYSREEIFRNAGSQGDIMRALAVLPGVVSAGAQFSAIAARGQGTQDNVYMVDDMPVFNLSHLEAEGIASGFNDPNGGRFSIFAPRVVDNVQFQNGGFDATFGRRSSSFLGLGIKEGNRESSTFSAQVELLGVTLIYDGPLTKKTSLFTSARYQNFAGVANLTGIQNMGSISLGDYLVKTTTEINSKNKLSFIAMYNPERPSRTLEDIDPGTNINDDNSSGLALWNHRGSSALVGFNLRTLTSTSSYWKNVLYFRASTVDNTFGYYTPSLTEDGEILDPAFGHHEEELRTIQNNQQEFGYRSIYTKNYEKVTLTAGVDAIAINLDYARNLTRPDTLYTFRSTDFRPDPNQYYRIVDPARFNTSFENTAFNGSAYASLSWNVTNRLTLNPGLRYDYTGFAEQHTLSPRLSGSLLLGERQSINFATGLYYQDVAYYNVAAQSFGNLIKNERTIQNILGYKMQFSPDLKFVAEVWHKQFDDLVVQPNRTESLLTNDGTGYAYGADFSLIKRLSKKYYGQVSYSYMQSVRDDNDGQGEYDYTFHIPHVFSLLGSYKPNDKWVLSAKFRYSTGRPIDDYIVHDNVFNDLNFLRYSQELTSRNGRLLNDFVSFDIRADYTIQRKRSDLTLFLDITDIQNTFNVNFEQFIPLTGQVSQSGLGMFPTFGVKVEF